MTNHSRRRFYQLSTLASLLVVRPLAAQQAPPANIGSGALEEVIVTGSRLPSISGASISPLTSLSEGQISATGLTRVEDILNGLPMFFANMTSNVSNGADGTAAVNLRGLGTQRTLVLVDGLRLGPGSADGRNWSDVNQIPAALIARVDVLTGGTSAVYGADAVAGVVNFILNDHFEGLRLDAGYHFDEHSNSDQDGTAQLVSGAGYPLPASRVDTGFNKNASLLAGSDFADHRLNATLYVTYDNQSPILQNQYDYSACNITPQPDYPPYTHLGCGGSGVTASGQFFASSLSGASLLDDVIDPKSGALRPLAQRDLYNYAPANYYLTPNVRWTAGTFLHADINPHAEVYANVMFMRNSMSAQVSPGGDFYDYSFIPCADPLLTAQQVATLCTPSNLAANGGNYELYDGKSYPGLNLAIGRRNVEGGGRTETFVNQMLRGVVGIKGAFGEAWTYNAHAQRGATDIHDNLDNYLGNSQLQQALNVLPGTGGAVCGGAVSNSGSPLVGPGTPFVANPRCIPWNIWVPGGVSAASLQSLYVPLQISGSVTEQVVSGSVTADLGHYGVKFPAAQLGMQLNVGAEWREEQSSYDPNAQLQIGNISGFGSPILPVAGAFSVHEVFSEARLPLASQQPFAEEMWLEGGLRYSSYSSGFRTDTYKLGLLWAPISAISLRGSYQRAVRAPDIGEFYAPQSISADGSVDPCEGPSPAASLAACELSGVKSSQYGHIAANPIGAYNGLQGGNPALKPEVAHTYTVGVLLQPQEVPDLQLSFDYFDIRVFGVMGVIGADTILLNCLASVGEQQASRFCPLVHRDGEGTLWLTPQGYVSDLEVNEGELATTGADTDLSYRVPLNAAGSLLLSLNGTRLQSLKTTPLAGSGSYDCAGLFGATCGVAPKWRHVLNSTWSAPWKGLKLGARWAYVGAAQSEEVTNNPFLAGTAWLPLSRIPAYSYFDLMAAVAIARNATLRLGVNNVLDKAPPLIVGGDCGSIYCNGNTFGGTYNSLGRYLFAQVTVRLGRAPTP